MEKIDIKIYLKIKSKYCGVPKNYREANKKLLFLTKH